jgi:hypothetical protein
MALIRTNPRSATIETVVDSELVLLRRDDFFDFVRNDPEGAVKLLWQFINVLADRLDRTSEELSLARLVQVGSDPVTLAPAPDTAPTVSDDPFSSPTRVGFQVRDLPVSSQAPLTASDVDDEEPLPEPPPPDADLASLDEPARPPSELDAGDDEEQPTRTFGPPLAERRSTLPVARTPVPPPDPSSPGPSSLGPSPIVDEPTPELQAPPRRAQRPTNPGSPHALRRLEVDTLRMEPSSTPSDPEGDSRFRPTKETVRLDLESEMGEKLEEMRRQFRERLAAERAKDPEKKSSDS